MIIYYPGNRSTELEQDLKHLKGKDVLLVTDQQMDRTMNELVNMNQNDIQDGTGEKEPFMFWVDEDPKDVTNLQKALHEEGRDLNQMAMKTTNNMDWTLRKLHDEVCAEARWFASREKLADLIKSADMNRLKNEPKYQQAVYSCYMLLQSDEEVPQRLLDLAIEMLEKANADE